MVLIIKTVGDMFLQQFFLLRYGNLDLLELKERYAYTKRFPCSTIL